MKRCSLALAAVVVLSVLSMLAASCGTEPQTAHPSGDAQKYPPGTSEEMLTETTGDAGLTLDAGDKETGGAEEKDEEKQDAAVAPEASVELAGARFTVVEVKRQNSNADVITSGQREVEGDYLEIELLVENIGDDLVDLSEFSFRIWSEGIAADEYEEYYGDNGAIGKYVSENMISAALLDYATLQPAAYKLKMKETADGVFLFYDLNPKSAVRNEGVTMEGTNFIIHKARGDDAGEEVEINLAGYPD